jgi:hypothetical protein
MIDSMHIALDDAVYKVETGAWPNELKPICESSGFKYRVGTISRGSIVRANQRLTLVAVISAQNTSKDMEEDEVFDSLDGISLCWEKNILRRIEFRIDYHSLYGEQKLFVHKPLSRES